MNAPRPHGHPKPHVDVVVVAASAGGVEAVRQVLASLPEDFPAAVLVVIHRTTKQPNLMAEVLAQVSRLPVKAAYRGERIRPGIVYVAPPDLHLLVDPTQRIALLDGHRIDTSQVFAMPAAAIATGHVDRVLPLPEIGPALDRIVRTGRLPAARAGARVMD